MRDLKKDKASNHLYYFTDDGVLYEMYSTIRGDRYRFIGYVPGFIDKDRLTDTDVGLINKLLKRDS